MSKILNHSLKFLGFFTFFFLLFNFRVSYISGNSMHPTLKNNSLIIVDKYLYKLFEIKRGDILILAIKDEEMIKRIAYLPGEKMEIEGHEINLKDDEIYVLGDNPKESIDSRNYGPVKTNNIVGKIFLSF
jgi:signal peptidase I